MRRRGRLWPEVIGFASLLRAARRAARGKRTTATAAGFLDALEPACLALQRALDDGTWQPGPTEQFAIRDPKPRQITVAPFVDRVVHHALIGALEPVFERRMIDHSFACRRGKGSHAAVQCAQRMLRRHRYALKLDVAAFFASLPHSVVNHTVARLVKDPTVLALVRSIVAGPANPTTSIGLPIGSLTSQWFANMVLDRVDHLVKDQLRIPGYVRYMDLCRAAHKSVYVQHWVMCSGRSRSLMLLIYWPGGDWRLRITHCASDKGG